MKKKVIKYKKASHVGIMLSFGIFVLFLIFLYLILAPATKIQNNKDSSLNYIQDAVLDYISTEVIHTQLRIDYNLMWPNYEVELGSVNFDFNVTKPLGGANLILLDSEGYSLDYGIRNKGMLFNFKRRDPSLDYVFDFYYSKEFHDGYGGNVGGGDALKYDNGDYSFEFSKNYNYVLDKKVVYLMDWYNFDPDTVRNRLGIKANDDFSISFDFNNGSIVNDSKIIPSTSVYTKDIQVEYINANVTKSLGILKLKVW